jgi:hypothetical protein
MEIRFKYLITSILFYFYCHGSWMLGVRQDIKTPLSDRLIYFGRRGILSEAESCSLVRSRLPGRPDNMVEAHPTIAGRHLP